jgi:hypothetical protein
MKTTFVSITVFLFAFALISFTWNSATETAPSPVPDHHFEIPDNAMKVIDKSCYGCHNSESPNEKGKKKLQFDKLGDLKTYKLVGTLTDIADVVANGDMPPEKFLNKKPEATPTAVEKKLLVDWAEGTAKKLSE